MKGKRVLVTGGAGFIGSHLVKRLIKKGAKVSITVKYRSLIDCVRLCSVWDDVEAVEADLRNTDSVLAMKTRRFDCVFHLAAYNHVGDSFLHVQESMMSNMLATANLMEHGPDYERFIYTASSEVYGWQESVPFREENIPHPISPYAIGKYAGELYAKLKAHQAKGTIICLRPFNTFGPYQSERAVIPELIVKCLRGKPVETTQGRQTREFNYVDNIIDGFMAAAQVAEVPEGPINIGTGKEISIRDLVQKIHSISRSTSQLKIGALQDRPTEIWRMCADNQRAQQLLNWRPRISFDDGLNRTVDWFRNFLKMYYGKSGLRKL